LDDSEGEMNVEETELLRDIRVGTEQIDAGQGISNRAARAELRKRLGL
jgi:hypothetical protein